MKETIKVVSIPYSSGHLFRCCYDLVFASPIPARLNPLFIRSSIPLKKRSSKWLTRRGLNPLFIRSSIPLISIEYDFGDNLASSQSLIHQVIYSVRSKSDLGNNSNSPSLNPLFIRSSIPFTPYKVSNGPWTIGSQSLIHQVIYSVRSIWDVIG